MVLRKSIVTVETMAIVRRSPNALQTLDNPFGTRLSPMS